MNTNKKEDLLKEYGNYEGMGVFMCIVAAASLFLTFLGGTLLYCLIDSIFK